MDIITIDGFQPQQKEFFKKLRLAIGHLSIKIKSRDIIFIRLLKEAVQKKKFILIYINMIMMQRVLILILKI